MPQVLVPLFSLVLFVALLVAGTFVYWGLQNRAQAARLELAHRLGRAPGVQARPRQSVPEWMGRLGVTLAQLQLRAGETEAPQGLLARILLFALGGALLAGLVLGLRGIGLGMLFAAVPPLLLAREARRRAADITIQLPDALDLICRALRAGHAFNDALRQAAIEVPAPLSEELSTVSEQHRMGLDLRDCLNELVDRNSDNFDIRLFVSVVLLHRDTGGNLIEVLTHLAETIRERLIFGEKVHALTAEVRISAIILGTLPFFVTGILFIMRPGYLLPLLTTDTGRIMLVGALASLLVGGVVMRQLSQVEA